MNRREARWLDLLAQFGITAITLKPGRVHVLGDTLSRILEAGSRLLCNNLQISSVELGLDFEYGPDQLFGPIVRAKGGQYAEDITARRRIEQLVSLFELKEGKLIYNGKVCVPRNNVRDLLDLPHDARVSDHFAFTKTLGRL